MFECPRYKSLQMPEDRQTGFCAKRHLIAIEKKDSIDHCFDCEHGKSAASRTMKDDSTKGDFMKKTFKERTCSVCGKPYQPTGPTGSTCKDCKAEKKPAAQKPVKKKKQVNTVTGTYSSMSEAQLNSRIISILVAAGYSGLVESAHSLAVGK